MAETRLEYDVGASRKSRGGVENQGGDAHLWLPEQQTLLVVDGVGGGKGNGEDVTREFHDLFQKTESFQNAVHGLIGKGFYATLSAVQLSKSPKGKAKAFVVGDSPLHQYDGKTKTLKFLAGNDNFWTKLLEIDQGMRSESEADSWLPLSLLDAGDLSLADESHIDPLTEKLHLFAGSQGYFLSKDVLELSDPERRSLLLGNKRAMLQAMIHRCVDILTMDLASDPAAIKKKLGDGLSFSLKGGDVLLVTTDGVVVPAARKMELLGDKNLSSQQIANALVDESIKGDDATAAVVRVQEVAA